MAGAIIAHLTGVAQGLTFAVQAPSEIAGAYAFSWAQPNDGWGTPDFTFGGNIQGVLELANDGTAGLNAQGNPISAHACNPLVNDLTGKIAVVFRNDCAFSQKALNAQNAGAIGVVIVNNQAGTITLGAGDLGFSVFIPVLMVSLEDGATLTSAMNNGPVEVFFGSKIGLFETDFGFASQDGSCALPFGLSYPTLLMPDDGMRQTLIQAEVINYGTQSGAATVTCTISKGGTTLYNESLSLDIESFGNIMSFTLPDFTNYDGIGEYTIAYTISSLSDDEDPNDNHYNSSFLVNDNDVFGFSQADPGTGLPLEADTYYGYTAGGFQACILFTDPNADDVVVEGLHFSAMTPEGVNIDGKTVEIVAHKFFDDSNPIDFGFEFEAENFATATYTFEPSQSGELVYASFAQPIELISNARYLFCVAAQDPEIFVGVDISPESHAYQTVVANYEYISPWNVAGQWYGGGYGFDVITNIGLQLAPIPLSATATVVTQLNCPLDCNGVIQVQSNLPNATVVWYDANGVIPFANSTQLTNACAGDYYAVVTLGNETVTTNAVSIQAPAIELTSSVSAPSSLICGSSAAIFLNIATSYVEPEYGVQPYTITVSVPQGLTDCNLFGDALTDINFSLIGGTLNTDFTIGGAFALQTVAQLNGTIAPGQNITLSASNFDYGALNQGIDNCELPIQFTVTLSIGNQETFQASYLTVPGQNLEFLNYVYGSLNTGTIDISWNQDNITLIDEASYHYSTIVTANTDYVVDIVYTDGCGNSQLNQHSFTIEAPTFFNLAVLTNPTAGPTPFNAVFNNQTPNLSNYQFEWNFGDGATAINNSSFVSHTYTTGGIWDVTLTAFEIATGCIANLVLADYIYSIGNGCLNPGCQDLNACNYDALADCDDDSCVYAQAFLNCLGECINDADSDGICDELEVPGCTATMACNYNPDATNDNSSCLFEGNACDDNNLSTINDLITASCDCQGTLFLLGCTDVSACNYNPEATNNDGSCIFPPNASITGSVVVSDFSESNYVAPLFQNANYQWEVTNGVIQSGQSTATISVFWAGQGLGEVCLTITLNGCQASVACTNIVITPGNDVVGCTNEIACNYNSNATLDDNNCIFIGDSCNDGDGTTNNDSIDNNCDCVGISNLIFGCTVSAACNFNPEATADDASCFFIGDFCDDGNELTEGDSIQSTCLCEGILIVVQGCTDPDGCNYDPLAVFDDGSCVYIEPGTISGDQLPSAFSESSYTYPATDGSTYLWEATNGVITSGQGSSEVVVFWGAQGNGFLSVQETNAENCTGPIVDFNVIITPVSVDDIALTAYKIYPNPADAQLFVEGISGSVRYFLHNSLGGLILNGTANSAFIVDTKHVAPGNYFLTLISKTEVSTQRITVVH
jgi:hypothetical protein